MKHFLSNLQEKEGLIGGHHAANGSPTEDGNQDVALHIFENIGIEHGFTLDIGAFSSKASNIVPIMEKYKIPGLLLDGVNKYHDRDIIKVWFTMESTSKILSELKCPKNLDYISIDIDNMDYWILKSVLEAGYSSNLLIAEFNPIFTHDEFYTKKYAAHAHKGDSDTANSSNYGASLAAFTKLLNTYGYRLIHVMQQNLHGDPSCNNAFFIKEKFDTENIYEDQAAWVQKFHPAPFIESFKQKNTFNKFGVSTLEEVKQILKNEWFQEV
jgi:hypothetical protein